MLKIPYLVGLALVASGLAPMMMVDEAPHPLRGGLETVQIVPDTPAWGESSDAGEDWNFTGENGSFEVSLKGGRWFDFAFPVWEEMDSDSVRINVTFTWDRPEDYAEGQAWSCGQWSTRPYRENATYPTVPYTITCWLWNGDRAMEVQAHSAGHRVDLGPPWPQCLVNPDCGPPEEWSRSWTLNDFESQRPYAEFLEHHDRPAAHMVVFAGGHEPSSVRVDAEWNDTVVSVSSGSFEDSFTFRREDFRSDLYVRADTVVCECHAQEGAALTTEVVDPGRRAVAWFSPNYHDYEDAGYRRPDGTEEDNFGLIHTDLEGPWRFWYTGSRGYVGDYVDLPVLWGTQLDWAELPWE